MPQAGTLKGDRLPKAVIAVLASTGMAIMLFIIAFLLREGVPILQEATLGEILTGVYWYPTSDEPDFGMLPLILGSISVTLLSSLLAIPISICLAIFLSEICPRGVGELFKPVLEILSFFPSVVLGFLGMMLIAPWLQQTFQLFSGLNMFNASVLMGIMIVPIISSLTEDSLSAIPKTLRDASYALGATRMETVLKVVVPAALPGILQACLLGIMRAIGETMVVLMAAGGAAVIPRSIMDPVRPLTSTIAAEMGETPVGSVHYNALFFIGVLLLVMTLLINLLAQWIEQRGKRWR
ncbi:MAG: phosphate ABC transporter permease subunit PstC [Synergistales bacterium]|nr:phosphate ABC transporter permease subunit PstC [Synergistales bacterium]